MKIKLFVLGLLALFAACSDDDHLSVAVTKKQLVNDIGGRYWNAVSVEKVGSNGKHYPVDIVQMYGENRSTISVFMALIPQVIRVGVIQTQNMSLKSRPG